MTLNYNGSISSASVCRALKLAQTGNRQGKTGWFAIRLVPRVFSSSSLLAPFPDGFSGVKTQKHWQIWTDICGAYLGFSMEKLPVKLYVYDISKGLARQLSPLLLGKFVA